MLPEVSTETMSLFLKRFSAERQADEHAVMVLDQAGWHGARALQIPGNVTLVPLPPHAPELNPVERVWLYLRERFPSHRLLDDCDAIVDACCADWNRLTPERLRSLCSYPYIQQINRYAQRYQRLQAAAAALAHRGDVRHAEQPLASPHPQPGTKPGRCRGRGQHRQLPSPAARLSPARIPHRIIRQAFRQVDSKGEPLAEFEAEPQPSLLPAP